MRDFFKIKVMMSAMVVVSFFPALCLAYCVSDDSQVHNALHLSIDVSGSIDPPEMVLQMEGIEKSLRDTEVQDKMLACGCTEITVVFWASTAKIAMEPLKLKSQEDLEQVIAFFQNESRRSELQRYHYGLSEMTEVDSALELSTSVLSKSSAYRRLILISGDGMDARIDPVSLDELRDLKDFAESNQIQVNAASILAYTGVDMAAPVVTNPMVRFASEVESESRYDSVGDFYLKEVVTRDGLVREAKTFADFQATMTESLKEIACKPMM